MPLALTPAERDLVASARTATLATIGPDGRPRLVPICYVVIDDVVWTPIDEKPKSTPDPRGLARVRDIEARPEVALLVDRWSEDWSRLAWLRLAGRATLVESPDIPAAAAAALRAKYPQYADHDLEHRPAIAITIDRATGWDASPAETDAARRAVE